MTVLTLTHYHQTPISFGDITCVGRTGNSYLSHITTVLLDNISPIHLLRSVIRATMYSEHCTYCTNIWLKTESIQGQLGNLIVIELLLQ